MTTPNAAPAPRPDSILSRVTMLIVEHLGADARAVTPQARLAKDLGADSLDRIELVIAVEETFGVEITDEEADACTTVQDIAALVARTSAAPAEAA
ncbi:acyl carrier protein [Falsiroseomonas selenitidurans]|uniref:Acyl carrier protein n=1 Tax=Falsiroseomonas selenitidurans TaxID=2716335 RepID=A0ABX1E5G7_9PROT|nr:acyl carrier protein [Falsiroseomonas selenitidurans]NKC30175.1 acyl carrier protein [Falsiroseomonas selenitidurans]